MFSKEQFQKRISGIVNEMETIEKKGTSATGEENKRFDELLVEFDTNTNTVNSIEGRKAKVRFSTFAEVKEFLKTPVNSQMRPNISSYDSNDNEFRVFNKENINELGPYIKSK